MTESKDVCRRYTDLASLLHMLRRNAITLLRPDTWDDRKRPAIYVAFEGAKQLV